MYKSKKAAKIVTMQEEGSEFEQTIAFLELETQEMNMKFRILSKRYMSTFASRLVLRFIYSILIVCDGL